MVFLIRYFSYSHELNQQYVGINETNFADLLYMKVELTLTNFTYFFISVP